jgi:Na+-driven multidrug efflux pump
MTLVGQNLGAKRPDQAERAGWMAFALGAGVMSAMGATFYTLAPQMFELFCPDPEQAPIIDAGVHLLRLVAYAMPPLAATIVFTNALRGAGDTRVPVLFTWVGFFAVRIPLAYFLAMESVTLMLPCGPGSGDDLVSCWEIGPFHGAGLGLYGCWLAMIADLVIRGLFFFARFVRGAWKLQRV